MGRYSLGGAGGDAAVTAINNATENEIVTVGSTTTELEAEATLTFASNKVIPTASAHDTVGTALTVSSGATTAGTTNNIAGGALTVQGGQGKGSGAGGDIIFQTANAGSSGSAVNALATALTLSDDLSAAFTGAITGTTIDASTDFTIGTTVITDDSIVMTPTSADTVTIAAAANGVLNITTVDDNAHAANLAVTVDGSITIDAVDNIELDSATGVFILEDTGTEVLRITEGNSGDVTVKLVTNAKDLIFTDNGDATGLTIKDAAVGIVVPGEVMTTKISYTDGDDAITIADGGGVTAAAGVTSTAAANAFGASSFAGDVAVADSKFVEFESAAGTPTTDNTVQGIVIEFLAVEAITQFDAVYVSTTTGRVGRADANDAAKMPVIGIAIEAQGSAGSSVRVLTHGVYRDDGGFGGNMTVGVDLYAPETPGTLTTTRPSDNGDFIQVIGVATGVRSAFINPSLDIIEHA